MRNSALTARQRLAMDACTECGQCLRVCPAAQASGDVNLSAEERMRKLKRLLRNGSPLASLLRRLPGKLGEALGGRFAAPSESELKDYASSVFRCSLCGDCEEVCPAKIPVKGLWLSLRQELARTGSAPAKIGMIKDNIAEFRNVFGEDNEERGDWVDDMRRPPEGGCQKAKADIVYFTGCTGAYFPLAQKIPMAFAGLLEQAHADYTILAGAEWCCGFPLLGSGQGTELPDIVRHNVEAVRARGASTVVFTCPSCYQTWREHYPAEFKLLHASELLASLATEGRLQLGELDMTVTYHDPCDLGRGSRVFDAPRRALACIPGLKLVEMAHSREHSLCCGGGGNLEMIDAGLSAKMAARRVQEALDTGAQAIVTTCQQCVRTMATYARRNKAPIEVLDLTQILERSAQAFAKQAKAKAKGA
ncbi:MAG: (Fe-S)-binding protein [Desulfovibrio sp.]|nr:(Fe-S)-binding protein [Desulfovibrio sp.]